jgi:hypothetical protein
VTTSTGRPINCSNRASRRTKSRSVRPGSRRTRKSTSLSARSSPRDAEPKSRTFDAPHDAAAATIAPRNSGRRSLRPMLPNYARLGLGRSVKSRPGSDTRSTAAQFAPFGTSRCWDLAPFGTRAPWDSAPLGTSRPLRPTSRSPALMLLECVNLVFSCQIELGRIDCRTKRQIFLPVRPQIEALHGPE